MYLYKLISFLLWLHIIIKILSLELLRSIFPLRNPHMHTPNGNSAVLHPLVDNVIWVPSFFILLTSIL